MFKKIGYLLYFVFTSSVLSASPWNLNRESREKIYRQIEEKHKERIAECDAQATDYFIDKAIHHVNFGDSDCALCAKNDRGLDLEASMQIAGFYKIRASGSIEGHCAGTSALFVKYVLEHGIDPAVSCFNLQEKIFPEGRYLDEAHLLSINQPFCYIELPPEYPPSALISKELARDRIWLRKSTMDRFFQIYLGEPPHHYFSILPGKTNPAEFDSAAIYATLQQLPQQILLISYTTHHSEHHCIAVSTHPDKLLIFDPNAGLYQFNNLETLSKVSGKVLQGSHLRWIAAFNLPDNVQ